MKKLRMAVRANTAWFAAKDVCDALGLGDVSVALRRLPSHGIRCAFEDTDADKA